MIGIGPFYRAPAVGRRHARYATSVQIKLSRILNNPGTDGEFAIKFKSSRLILCEGNNFC